MGQRDGLPPHDLDRTTSFEMHVANRQRFAPGLAPRIAGFYDQDAIAPLARGPLDASIDGVYELCSVRHSPQQIDMEIDRFQDSSRHQPDSTCDFSR